MRPAVGTLLTLACSCHAEVVAATIIMLPRHHLVRIVKHGDTCRMGSRHARRRRIVVMWSEQKGRRVYRDQNVSNR